MRGRLLLLALIVAAPAGAEPLPARLLFRREGAGTRCPDEEALRRGVSARLGHDPFRADAPRTLAVKIGPAGEGLGATIVMTQGGRRARRTLASARPDCGELQAAIELTVSLAIDPLWEPPAPEPEPEPQVEILDDPPPAPPARLDEYILIDDGPIVEKRADPGPFHLGVGSSATLFTAPDLVVSMRVELGLRVRRLTFTLEPWLTLPASTAAPGGFVTLSTAAISATACMALGPVDGCVEAAGGVVQAVGEGNGFVRKSRARAPFAGLGVRAVRAWTLYRGIGVRTYLDLLVPVVRTTLYAESSNGRLQVWSTPKLLPSLGIAFVGQFR